MLSAEALRLVAIEALCPTEAIAGEIAFPTLAGRRVYDSKAAPLEDLDRSSEDGTPVLSLYTLESGVKPRGLASADTDSVASAVLEVIAEIAIVARDGGEEYADAAETDPEGRLVLAALCAQVRHCLMFSQRGALWRKIVRQVEDIDQKTFAVPELGLRFQRVNMRFHCSIRDDEFATAGGLPEPLASVFNQLSEQSYAKAKLQSLAGQFQPAILPRLQGVDLNTNGPVHGAVVNFT
ncbi:hypothetical protein PVA19_15380 [Agrobacterium sp. CNPSo 3708]|uniref:hypothetical protein n=1 Tax=Agrobacterium sp. CNPSo 3708 TaxID=3028150 RepID=UPI0023640E52|nr:hypothetical protein [Agrobacterium sp. CNPSo 3708]MDD1499803.1 hypothetical protein [Agrobacterium sp. CNPSo 3708]